MLYCPDLAPPGILEVSRFCLVESQSRRMCKEETPSGLTLRMENPLSCGAVLSPGLCS